jgi:hypothetical protein
MVKMLQTHKRDSLLAVPFAVPQQVEKRPELDGLDVLCLPALGAFGDVKLNALTFLKRAETARLDGGVVNEYILTIFAAQKSKTLGVIKPLNCSLFHDVAPLLLIYRTNAMWKCLRAAVTVTGKDFVIEFYDLT